MHFAAYQVLRPATVGVEVGGVRHGVCIYRNNDPLPFRLALEHCLTVGQEQVLEVSITERAAGTVRLGHRGYRVSQFVPLRRLEARAEAPVAVALVALGTPLAAVVDAGNARHGKHEAIYERYMRLVLQDSRRAGDVVIVAEAEEVAALVKRPVLRSELALEAVDSLKHVHAVEAGIQPLVALVVRDAVEHPVVHPAVIVAVERFAQEKEVAQPVAEGAQTAQEVEVQAVGNVQAQAVYPELVAPELHGVEYVVRDGGVAEVELHELIVALPTLVPKAVVIAAVAAEINVEPVLVGRVPLLFLHVAECPEATAHMVKNTVEDDADAVLFERLADRLEVLVSAEAAVCLAVIPRVVAVAVALKHGTEIKGVRAELFYVLRPVRYL